MDVLRAPSAALSAHIPGETSAAILAYPVAKRSQADLPGCGAVLFLSTEPTGQKDLEFLSSHQLGNFARGRRVIA